MFACINLCAARNNFDLACLGFVHVVGLRRIHGGLVILCVFSIFFLYGGMLYQFSLFLLCHFSVFNVARGCNHQLNKNYVCEL